MGGADDVGAYGFGGVGCASGAVGRGGARSGSGELSVERLRGAPSRVVLGFLEELGRPVRAVYEAGPSGFGLTRAAGERGVDVRVIAPGSIPRAPGDRVKTDRRDAKRLVRLFAAGELSFAFVPSEADA